MAFANDLRQLQSKKHLLKFLAISEASFDRVANFEPGHTESAFSSNFDEYAAGGSTIQFNEEITFPVFFRHDIPKKNPARGCRTVWEAVGSTKYVYKALSRRLNVFFTRTIDNYPHPRSFGYVVGRNISENAAGHCGRKFLLSVDIDDFFPSISTRRVCNLMASTGISEEVSRLLGNFLTIEGKLPLGLAPSPVVANAICLPIDVELNRLAERVGAYYSRYADDISFSSGATLPDLAEVRAVIADNGFELADEKTRKSKIGQAHYVTGLSVSDPKRPHIPRSKKRRLRQELYYAEKYTLVGHFGHSGITVGHQAFQQEVNRLDGMVKFAAFHEPGLAPKIKSIWAKVLREGGHMPGFEPKNADGAPFVLVFDEAEFAWGERKCLALGISVSQHQDVIDLATEGVLDDELSDVWAAGNKEAIRKRGVHFADATEDLRLRYVDAMRALPFEGYVALAQLDDPCRYEATYLRLLGAIVRRRLMAAESRCASLLFEENSKVSQMAITTTVTSAFKRLAEHDHRRPRRCEIGFASKPAPQLSVPDFMLGVLGKYLRSGPDNDQDPPPRDKLMFERLRDKYRLILDCDSGTEYSRRRPISP